MSRENVFNFVTIRPAQRVESTEDLLHFTRYSVSEKSPLQEQIEALTDDRRAGAIELAWA
jgi:hypothetical protein